MEGTDKGLTPMPKPQTPQPQPEHPKIPVEPEETKEQAASLPTEQQSDISPTPQMQSNPTTATEQQEKESSAPATEEEQLESQRITPVRGISDVWHNLQIDIKLSKTNEDIAECLNVASRTLKNFVKFHKILFEILNKASEFRRKGPNEPVDDDSRLALLNKVENWKMELR
jgi:hypothetical protein